MNSRWCDEREGEKRREEWWVEEEKEGGDGKKNIGG